MHKAADWKHDMTVEQLQGARIAIQRLRGTIGSLSSIGALDRMEAEYVERLAEMTVIPPQFDLETVSIELYNVMSQAKKALQRALSTKSFGTTFDLDSAAYQCKMAVDAIDKLEEKYSSDD